MQMNEGRQQEIRSPARWRWFALAAAAVLPYLHTLQFGFINYDDAFAIVNLPIIRDLSWRSLPRFFVPDIYDGLYEYMPLKNLSYAVDAALVGTSAPAFRPQQIFWYVASVLGAYAWLRVLLRRLAELGRLELTSENAEWLAFGTSLLFALHPAHVESVTWLSGRKDVLSGAFMLAALGCGAVYSVRVARQDATHGVRAWPYCAASLGCVALALLSKPTAVMTAPLLLAQEFWLAPTDALTLEQRRARLRSRAWLHVPAWFMTLGFALIYERVAGKFAGPPLPEAGNVVPNVVVRLGEQLARALQLVLSPSALTPIVPDHLFDAALFSLAAMLGYASIILLAAVFAGGARRRHPLSLAIVLFVVPIMPSIIRPVWGQYVAGRYLFHALIGPTLALVWLGLRALEHRPRVRVPLIAAASTLPLIWAGGTIAYNSAFRSSDALWAYAIGVDPQFPRFYDLAARAALMRGDADYAQAVLKSCVEAVPKATECAAPLGGLLLRTDPKRGEARLLQVLPHDRSGTAHLRLAQHWSQHGRTREALALYESWLNGKTTGPDQLGALVDLAIADGQLVKAREYLRRLVAAASVMQPATPPRTREIARAAERAGDPAMAEQVRAAADRCNRSDCLAAALGVRP
jgi:hypothetical protein